MLKYRAPGEGNCHLKFFLVKHQEGVYNYCFSGRFCVKYKVLEHRMFSSGTSPKGFIIVDGVQWKWLPRWANTSLSANTARECDFHSCEVLNDAECLEVSLGEEWGKGLQEQVKCGICLGWGCLEGCQRKSGNRTVLFILKDRWETWEKDEGCCMRSILAMPKAGRAKQHSPAAQIEGGELVLWVVLPSLQLESQGRNWTRYRRQKNTFFTVDAIGPKRPCAPW